MFLFECCADGVCAGGCIAGADIDFFSSASAGAVVIYAVGNIAGNAGVLMTSFAGLFGRIVHNIQNPFNQKIFTKDVFFFRNVLWLESLIFIHLK